MAKYAQLTATGLPHGVLLTIEDSTGKQVSNLYPEANANAPDNRARFADGTGAISPATYVPNGTYIVAYSGGSQTVVVSGASGTPADSMFIDLATQAELDAAGTAASGTYGPAGISLAAYGLADATTDIKTVFDAAVAAGVKRMIVPYRAAAWPALTRITLSDVDVLFAPGARIAFNHGDVGMELTRCRLLGGSFTSVYTGPASAGDAVPFGSGGKYDLNARCVKLNDNCYVADYTHEYASGGIWINGPGVVVERFAISNIRQYQGWGAAVHRPGAVASYSHVRGGVIINCDRAYETESGASFNITEGGYVQGIGPNGYTGQPAGAGYADYTSVLDVHSHSGEGACSNNVYRNIRVIDSQGAITCSRANGTNDSDMPRNNRWENITIEGRVGITGNESVYLQGHRNKALGLRFLAGSGITSMMRINIPGGGVHNEIEVAEATAYAMPFIKDDPSGTGRGNKITAKIASAPTAGTADWLMDIYNPDTELVIDIKDASSTSAGGIIGYCALKATASYSRISGYYEVRASTTGMTQAFRVMGAANARIDAVGIANTNGLYDVNATNSTTGLVINLNVARGGQTAVNFDATTSLCELTPTSNLGSGAVTDAGTNNSVGPKSATATLDFPSIAAAGSQELTVTVTGAKTGDTVHLGPPAAIEAGLTWAGYVSAADTVKVRVTNPTAAAIDPASATWRVTATRA